MSWNDAAAFGRWLSKKEGKPYRLPTEAEWELACRAGSQTRYCFGDDPKDLSQYDWVAENSDGRTHPVGQKKSNAWGLFDMQGSVLEWCSDWWALYSAASSDDPAGPDAGSFRVLRGGCWNGTSAQANSARRGGGGPATAGNNVGFRIVRTLPWSRRAGKPDRPTHASRAPPSPGGFPTDPASVGTGFANYKRCERDSRNPHRPCVGGNGFGNHRRCGPASASSQTRSHRHRAGGEKASRGQVYCGNASSMSCGGTSTPGLRKSNEAKASS